MKQAYIFGEMTYEVWQEMTPRKQTMYVVIVATLPFGTTFIKLFFWKKGVPGNKRKYVYLFRIFN